MANLFLWPEILSDKSPSVWLSKGCIFSFLCAAKGFQPFISHSLSWKTLFPCPLHPTKVWNYCGSWRWCYSFFTMEGKGPMQYLTSRMWQMLSTVPTLSLKHLYHTAFPCSHLPPFRTTLLALPLEFLQDPVTHCLIGQKWIIKKYTIEISDN